MNMEKLTQKAAEAIMDTQKVALSHGNPEIGSAHLLYSLLYQEEGLIPQLLKYMSVDVESVKKDAEGLVNSLPSVTGTAAQNPYVSAELNKIFIEAENIAKNFKDEYISVEHLFMALLDKASSRVTAF